MARSRVRMNSAGARELLKDRGIARDMHTRAERVAAVARTTAPVDTGRFAASFEVVDAMTDRAVGRVVTNDPKGLFKEARSRTMTRALDAAR